jgi:type II secretory pathway pseudopilin PulG
MKTRRNRNDTGNVFFVILIAVMLFAALTFTFTRGIQQGGNTVSQRQAELIASDMMTYAQRVERGVQKVLGERISENVLSFENSFVSGYSNPSCTVDSCRVFAPQGGGVAWQSPPANANTVATPYVYVTNRVGSADGTTRQIGTAARDLVILTPVSRTICEAINKKANQLDFWESTGAHNDSTLFTGNYESAAGTVIANGNADEQPRTGCFCDSGGGTCSDTTPYYFYSVIYER